MSSVSIYPYSQLNHNIFYRYKDEETTTNAKPSRKRSKSAASNANEPRKRRMTVGEGLDNVGDKMGGILETLDVIAHPNKSGHSTLPDKRAPAIKAIQQNELFTEDDFADLWSLLTDKYEIGSVYLAIENLEQRTRYLQKQLERYRKTL